MENFSQKTKKELEKILQEKTESLRKFRFDMTGSKVKNIKEGMLLKKDVARILTVLNSKKEE
jgi:ribosomal protein L29